MDGKEYIFWLVKVLKKKKEAIMLLAGLGIVVLFTSISGIGCPIKWLTGISCAGCGMTRAVFYAVQLQFSKAFYYHPLFWMMPFLVLLYLFWDRLAAKVQKNIVWAVVICFVVVYLIRLFGYDQDIVVADVSAGLLGRLWKHFL